MLKNIDPYPQSEPIRIKADCFAALKAWRVWLYMGTQDVRNQFRRSRLGIAWLIINLTLMASCIGYIYGHLFHIDLKEFFPALILGLTLWIFISNVIAQGCQTFIVSEGYIKQFSLSKQVYIFRFLISAIINLLVGLIIFCGVAWYTQIKLQVGSLWFLPGMAALILISMGHLIIFSYLGTRFRDLSHAITGVLQILFYVTPIIFSTDMLRERGLSFVYQFNPLYYLIEIVRFPLLHASMAATEVYLFALVYGIVIWSIALITLIKCDAKVAYWL